MVDIDDSRHRRRPEARLGGRHWAGSRSAAPRPRTWPRCSAYLSTSTSQAAFADCDVVVEAVTENEKLKTAMYRLLGKVIRPDAILASNTSTISITRMAASAPDPARFVGMHFFYPVDRMELVEVIRGEKTSDETVATIVALAKAIRKTPIVVRDCPGFLVNRVLFPYMNEALLLLTEGASMDAIDKAATAFGMPMGPIALEDLVGLDTSWYAGQVMLEAYPDRGVPTPILGDLVKAGRLGKKSGAGFRRVQRQEGEAGGRPRVRGVSGEVPDRRPRPERRGDHRPDVPGDAPGDDAGGRGGDRPRAGRRRHGADPGHRLPAVPGGHPPLVRQRRGGGDPRAPGAIHASRQAVRADRDA